MLTHMHPSQAWFACKTSPNIKGPGVPALSLGQTRNRQVPRASLPASGVTSGGEMSRISSEGVTPPSLLIPTHAPDQTPPADFGGTLFRPVFAGCCQPLLEDGPSRRYLHSLCKGAWTCTPPRSCHSVRLCALPPRTGHWNPRTSASLSERHARHANCSPQCNFHRGVSFEAAVIR
jgi:hypothetical protein